jgi:RNA polymerase sigma factor (TIGR02999 family)
MSSTADATQLLVAAQTGDGEARERLSRRVYDTLRDGLRQRAGRSSRAEAGGTTAPVTDAWTRLIDASRTTADDRACFLSLASRAMRLVLVDQARPRTAARTAGPSRRGPTAAQAAAQERAVELVDLAAALDELAALDAHLADIASLHFFGGLSFHDIADVTGRTVPSVKLDWVRARAWLYRSMQQTADARP